jgi:3D (Asp-Asp-Asp) domain-containing protein
VAIKAGQILHDAYGFIIDRIQTGGATSLNIPEEKVYEVGNFNAVGTVRDSPDLSFDLETFDATTEIESLLTFIDPVTVTSGDMFDLSTACPIDIISPIKDAWKVYTSTHGVIIPYLTLESSAYRFELRGNHTQRHTLRGDSYFFVDSPIYEEFDGDGATATFPFAEGPAQPYNYGGKVAYALGVSVVDSNRVCTRLFLDDHYTNTDTDITLTDPTLVPMGSTLRVTYGAAGVVKDYPQSVNADTDVKPAALRGRNVDVYIGTDDATPVFSRWSSVQSAEVNFSLTLDKDEEFGNAQYVAQDHDVPEVSGNIVVRPRDVAELWDKVYQVTNVAPGEVAGPLTSVTLPMEIRLTDPDDGTRLKTLYIPDARFKPPAIEGRVQSKSEPTFEWTSDGGVLEVYDGTRM